MTLEDVVVFDLEDETVEGSPNPSSGAKTHQVLFNYFQGIGVVTRTHSSCATAWSQTLRAIPIYETTHADYLPENGSLHRVDRPEGRTLETGQGPINKHFQRKHGRNAYYGQ